MKDKAQNKKKPLTAVDLQRGVISTAFVTGYGGRTVRFEDGGSCCTCTYAFNLESEERHQLARRIAAALNATRNVNIDDLERMAR